MALLGRFTFTLAALLLIGIAAGYGEMRHPALAALANFRLHLGLLAAGLGVLAGILSLRQTSGLAFAAMLLAAWGLGPVLDRIQDGTARPGHGRQITLLYANLWNRNAEPARLRAALIATDADILITSETMRAVTDGAEGLRAHYPYRLVSTRAGPVLRTAIWSKFPLRDTSLTLDNNVAPTGAAATADLGGGLRLGVIGGHFSRPSEGLQRAQADGLGTMAAGIARPLVVAADFNAAPWTWVVRRAAEVTGTRIAGGHRITWKGSYETPFGPLPEPWGHQIDQVLATPDLGIEEVTAIDLPGSDHRGIFVRLLVSPP
jgi:endonuclease/exonuclease/phosphatase (EEP) superfamily protein YafD